MSSTVVIVLQDILRVNVFCRIFSTNVVFSMSLYERIRNLAKIRGVSIRSVDSALGFGNGTIGKWDSVAPTADKVRLVADYFGVTVDYLLTGETKEKPDYSVELSESHRILLDRVNQMTEEQAARFVQVLDAFLKM